MGVALAAAATNGCNVGFGNNADSAFGTGGATDPGAEGDAGNFDGGDFKADASAVAPSLGSPLCNLTHFPACTPDDAKVDPCVSTTHAPPTNGDDAGDGGEDAGMIDLACHVRALASDGGTTIGPTCLPAGQSVDGEGCLKATDCAAGYECVGSPGVCRHYCCDGRCTESGEFCDIETDVDSLKVPVCALAHACIPLSMGGCADGETCSIVSDDGTTSCISQGPGKVGESCEETNCAIDLTCLGSFGSRKCFQLCDPTHPCSAAGDKCISSPATLFKQAGLGVCQNY